MLYSVVLVWNAPNKASGCRLRAGRGRVQNPTNRRASHLRSSLVPHTPEDYWTSYEAEDPIEDLSRLLAFIESVSDQSEQVVWRGVADHRWALHSRLYRKVIASAATPSTERDLQKAEAAVVETAREWGLDRVPSGLSGLELLAKLQHTGSPTRLIDVTHNPLVAAWFACESNGAGADGRIFAIDYSGLELIDDGITEVPWLAEGNSMRDEFGKDAVWVWTPPPVDPRMAAQSGAFLVGPVPTTVSGGKWYNADDTTYQAGGATGRYTVAEVRRLTSVSVRAYETMRRGEKYRQNPLVSVRVASAAKAHLRARLGSAFNLKMSLLFPDAYGLAMHLDRT